MSRRDSIESLIQDIHRDTTRYILELERLSLAAGNIRRLELQEEEQGVGPPAARTSQRQVPSERRATDRDNNTINIGDTILFLTQGRFRSTQGTVTRFSRNLERVFARDKDGNEVPRSPRNVRVIQDVVQ